MGKQNESEISRENKEIDLFLIFLILWKHRAWIAVCAITVGCIGALYTLTMSPLYRSEGVIAPRQAAGGASRLISQLGGGGGGLGSSTISLEHMEVIVKSHGLAASVIRRNDLMPVLFPAKWDKTKNSWKSGEVVPSIKFASELLRSQLLRVNTNRGAGTIAISIEIGDSVQARDIVEYYITELRERVKADVMRDAELNKAYLMTQLDATMDPVAREKIHVLVGLQVERAMFMSNQPFDVLEEPIVPLWAFKPNRKLIVVISLLIGAMIAVSLLALRVAEERVRGGANSLNLNSRAKVSLWNDLRAFRSFFSRIFRDLAV